MSAAPDLPGTLQKTSAKNEDIDPTAAIRGSLIVTSYLSYPRTIPLVATTMTNARPLFFRWLAIQSLLKSAHHTRRAAQYPGALTNNGKTWELIRSFEPSSEKQKRIKNNNFNHTEQICNAASHCHQNF